MDNFHNPFFTTKGLTDKEVFEKIQLLNQKVMKAHLGGANQAIIKQMISFLHILEAEKQDRYLQSMSKKPKKETKDKGKEFKDWAKSKVVYDSENNDIDPVADLDETFNRILLIKNPPEEEITDIESFLENYPMELSDIELENIEDINDIENIEENIKETK